VSTRAIELLKKEGIAFETKEYKHQQKGALFASKSIGFPPKRTIKTLVVSVGKKGYILALVPGDKQLNLKAIARYFSVKKAEMVAPSIAERLTGYMVGGISPFGTKKTLPVVMEIGLLKFDRIAINGGKRGLMIILDPRDIIRAVKCNLLQLTY